MRRTFLALIAVASALPGIRGVAQADGDGDAVPAAWVEIATAEHRRGDPAGLDPFLEPTTEFHTRRRAITALGRLGDRKGVEPRLRMLLERGGEDVLAVVWAAGISAIPGLVTDLLAMLPAAEKTSDGVAAAVLEALGRVKDVRADGFLRPWADARDPALAFTALEALMRLGSDRNLDVAARRVADSDLSIRRASAMATWRLAGMRRQSDKAAAKKEGRPTSWDGDETLARRVAEVVRKETDAEARIVLFRALNALTPKGLSRGADRATDPVSTLLDALSDSDPRVRGDMALRLGAGHEGPALVQALETIVEDSSLLVQQMVDEALDELDRKGASAGVARPPRESAPATRKRTEAETLLAALKLRFSEGTIGDAPPIVVVDNASTRAWLRSVILRSENPDALTEALLKGVGIRDQVAPAKHDGWISSPSLRAFLLDVLGEHEKAEKARIAAAFLKDADAGVRGQAAALLAKAESVPDVTVGMLLAGAYAMDRSRTGVDARIGVLDAVAEREDWRKAAAPGVLDSFVKLALSDLAPTVRLAARKAAAKFPSLAAHAKEEDPAPNEWRGLPRPKTVILGLDLTKGDGWLSEAEILRLARAIGTQRAQVVFETNRGTMRFDLFPSLAPVHCANLVLCAASGVYDGTPWHRVVPAFVIQGGDPRGDGSGDAGYAIPDEINATRFERGVLGMPKSTKDTGGCQVFVMHCAAPHLDGAYTAFGRVVDGVDVVDRIVVGDRIRSARVESSAPAPR